MSNRRGAEGSPQRDRQHATDTTWSGMTNFARQSSQKFRTASFAATGGSNAALRPKQTMGLHGASACTAYGSHSSLLACSWVSTSTCAQQSSNGNSDEHIPWTGNAYTIAWRAYSLRTGIATRAASTNLSKTGPRDQMRIQLHPNRAMS
jgi:hypothetical protein